MTDVQTQNETELSETEPVHPGCALSTRRLVLLGAGAVGATAVLAACGTDNTSTNANGSDYSTQPAPAGSKGADAGGTGDGGGSTAKSGGGTALAKVADVKVGGGVITADFVITQPEAGTYKAFTKVCPHAGCDVNKIDAGVIKCPCHGSQFSIKDGSVKGGPAPKGLPETSVKVDGDNVVKA
jgi:Rieske Fe-S protein